MKKIIIAFTVLFFTNGYAENETTFYSNTQELSVNYLEKVKSALEDQSQTDQEILQSLKLAHTAKLIHCGVSTPALYLTSWLYAPLAGITSEVGNLFLEEEKQIGGLFDNIKDAITVPATSCKNYAIALSLVRSEAYKRGILE